MVSLVGYKSGGLVSCVGIYLIVHNMQTRGHGHLTYQLVEHNLQLAAPILCLNNMFTLKMDAINLHYTIAQL